MDDFFAELEAEIKTAVAKEAQLRNVEKLRKKSNNMRLPHEERARIREEYAALNRQLQAELWTVVAEAAMFMEQQCDGCGSRHRVFLQFMQKLEHKRMAQTHWERITRLSGKLPKELIIQPHTTHVCHDCVSDHGFDSAEETWLAPRNPVLPSKTYEADDINEGDYNAPSEEN